MKRFHFIDDENKEQLDLSSLLIHCFDYKVTEEQAEEAAEELRKYLKTQNNE